jgi:hypothetical protein
MNMVVQGLWGDPPSEHSAAAPLIDPARALLKSFLKSKGTVNRAFAQASAWMDESATVGARA